MLGLEGRQQVLLGLFCVFITIILTVYGQLVIKWQVGDLELPPGLIEKAFFVVRQYFNPWVISALLAAVLASAAWMIAMTQLDLSFAYPFTSLSFVSVLFLSAIFFGESLSWQKITGTLIIIVGLLILNR